MFLETFLLPKLKVHLCRAELSGELLLSVLGTEVVPGTDSVAALRLCELVLYSEIECPAPAWRCESPSVDHRWCSCLF
jgi:hypothetical protein